MSNIKQAPRDASIENDSLLLRPVKLSDVTEDYVAWLNDVEVTQFLETRFQEQTLQTVHDYVAQLLGGQQHSVFLAIIEKASGRHIGNIKIGPINPYHHFADVSLFIGDKKSWGKGYATAAISLVVRYAFQVLKLHRLNAYIYDPNKGSQKAFLKAGFKEEGVCHMKRLFEGRFVDERIYGIVNKEFV